MINELVIVALLVLGSMFLGVFDSPENQNPCTSFETCNTYAQTHMPQ